MRKLRMSKCWLWLFWVGAIVGSVAFGFYLSRNGLHDIDDTIRYKYSLWLLYKYGLLPSEPSLPEIAKWYGPLWDFILGITTELLLPWLKDPHWIRHALTLSLFPITLLLTFVLLRKARVQLSTALLAVAMLYGTIRFGGYTIYSKDFPAAALYLLISIYLWVRLRSEQERWNTLRWSKKPTVPYRCSSAKISMSQMKS